jgi:hypothetical protein
VRKQYINTFKIIAKEKFFNDREIWGDVIGDISGAGMVDTKML